MESIEVRIDNGKGTIYHELGHAFGYCLASKSESTSLGGIKSVEIGLKVNRVQPLERLYHFESFEKERSLIYENTKNIDRTIAWFIEVMSGCNFQTLFESRNFRDCFGIEDFRTGRIDFGNMAAIRNISSFKWTFDDVFELQLDYQNFLISNSVLKSLEYLVDDIATRLKQKDSHQLLFIDIELDNLLENFDSLFTDDVIAQYSKLVSKYSSRFLKKY